MALDDPCAGVEVGEPCVGLEIFRDDIGDDSVHVPPAVIGERLAKLRVDWEVDPRGRIEL